MIPLWLVCVLVFAGLLAIALVAVFVPQARRQAAVRRARLEEVARYRVLGVADQIRDVVDDRNLRMDDGVAPAHPTDGEPGHVQLVADLHGAPGFAELGRGGRIGVEHRVRVGLHQRGQPFTVGMVGMLVGDQDRRQPGHALEAVREITRIEQQGGAVELGENT